MDRSDEAQCKVIESTDDQRENNGPQLDSSFEGNNRGVNRYTTAMSRTNKNDISVLSQGSADEEKRFSP